MYTVSKSQTYHAFKYHLAEASPGEGNVSRTGTVACTCWVDLPKRRRRPARARARIETAGTHAQACDGECTTETRQFKKEYTIGWTAAKHAVGGTRRDHTVR